MKTSVVCVRTLIKCSLLTLTHTAIASDFAVIDSFWTLSANTRTIPKVFDILGKEFTRDEKRVVDGTLLYHFAEPILNVPAVPRYYGESGAKYFVKTDQDFVSLTDDNTVAGTLLYVGSKELGFKLAGYVGRDKATHQLDNQKINSDIITEALSGPIGITNLAAEMHQHIFKFLSSEDIYNILSSSEKLGSSAQLMVGDSLIKLQKEGPLKVIVPAPGMPIPGKALTLGRLLPYEESITRIILSGQPNEGTLERLHDFYELQELSLDGEVPTSGFQYLPSGLKVLILQKDVLPDDEALRAIAKACPNLHTLGIHNAKKITESGLESFLRERPELRFLTLFNFSGPLDLEAIKRTHTNLKLNRLWTEDLEDLKTLEGKEKEYVTSIRLADARKSGVAKKILEDLAQFPNLTELYLDGQNYLKALDSLPRSLEVLILGKGIRPYDKIIGYIANRCPRLRVLSIRDGIFVTDIDLRKLLESCPSLELLDISHANADQRHITVSGLKKLSEAHSKVVIRNPWQDTLEDIRKLLPYKKYISSMTLCEDADSLLSSGIFEELRQFPHLEKVSVTLKKSDVTAPVPEQAIQKIVRSLSGPPSNPKVKILLGSGYKERDLYTKALSELKKTHRKLRIKLAPGIL